MLDGLASRFDTRGLRISRIMCRVDYHEPPRAVGRPRNHSGAGLDIACGIGCQSIELTRTGIFVDGMDISSRCIAIAREHPADASAPENTTFEVRDARKVDTIDEEYDLVLHWFAFGYFDDEINEGIADLFRDRVAPNGAWYWGWIPDWLNYRTSGTPVCSSKEMSPGPASRVPSRIRSTLRQHYGVQGNRRGIRVHR